MTIYPSKMAPFAPTGSKRPLGKMTPMPHLVKNTRGQLTVFFAVTLVMVITVTAFIVNVGMYVKAKINLQNAVDAAAWSGAAVQSRQLSDIAYLNWEMRNAYKELMFKYYVLGGLSLTAVKNPGAATDPVTFRMEQFAGTGPMDPYSFPSVCIDLSLNSNICKIYNVPGLPRFPPTGNVGTDQTSQAFLDAIAAKKGEDCSQRSRLNFAALAQWIYSAEGVELSAAPLFVGKRPGAYLKALEIAMRIRNLEKMVNEPPVEVCSSGCSQEYAQWYNNAGEGPHRERTIKAYWAALRNLGLPDGENEAPRGFTLTELNPTPYSPSNAFSVSNLLIPKLYPKYYLDLKIYLINYALFYTAFVANQNTSSNGVPMEAECAATKIALPVPGYPVGFEKNPLVNTYYAVKGQADFIGLLNPFREPPKLVAYSAAKPFGGRIGPRLFKAGASGDDSVISFNTNPPRSNQYAIGMKLTSRDPSKGFLPGDAIPFNDGNTQFWVSENDPAQAIGGWIEGDKVRFVLPNMVYEYNSTMPQVAGGNAVQVIQSAGGTPPIYGDATGGLFDKAQFTALRNNLVDSGGGGFDSNELLMAIENVRAPTRYDAYNYLIPTDIQSDSNSGIDSFQIVSPDIAAGVGSNPASLHEFKIYAPFYNPGDRYLYKSQVDVTEAMKSFIEANQPAIEKYRITMKSVADAIFASGVNTNNANIYQTASEQIYGLAPNGKIACQSVAGDFISFYLGDTAVTVGPGHNAFTVDYPDTDKNPLDCPPSLIKSFTDYLSKFPAGTETYYLGHFRYKEGGSGGWGGANDPQKYLTAYMPGVRHGATDDLSGKVKNPFNPSAGIISARRNFYSTKFVAVKSLLSNGHYISGDFPHYMEGNISKTEGDTNAVNPLQVESDIFYQ